MGFTCVYCLNVFKTTKKLNLHVRTCQVKIQKMDDANSLPEKQQMYIQLIELKEKVQTLEKKLIYYKKKEINKIDIIHLLNLNFKKAISFENFIHSLSMNSKMFDVFINNDSEIVQNLILNKPEHLIKLVLEENLKNLNFSETKTVVSFNLLNHSALHDVLYIYTNSFVWKKNDKDELIILFKKLMDSIIVEFINWKLTVKNNMNESNEIKITKLSKELFDYNVNKKYLKIYKILLKLSNTNLCELKQNV